MSTIRILAEDGMELGTASKDGRILDRDGTVVGQAHTNGTVFACLPDGDEYVGRVTADGTLYDAYALPVGRVAESGAIVLGRALEQLGRDDPMLLPHQVGNRMDPQLVGGAALVLAVLQRRSWRPASLLRLP